MSHTGIKIMQSLFRGRINNKTKTILAELADGEGKVQKEAEAQLAKIATSKSDPFHLGETDWGYPVLLPMELLVNHSLVIGSSGAGKSYLALLLLNHALSQIATNIHVPMGILDAKGELAAKVIQYIHAHMHGLSAEQQQMIRKRICVIDFAQTDYVTPYNILSNEYMSKEMLVNNRIQTIDQIYGGSAGLTTRMKSLLKYMLLLLIEFQLPISFFDKLCLDNALLQSLAGKSKDSRLRSYFIRRFPKESKSTVYGLAQRIENLFVSKGVRLSMSASSAPDFQKLQDEGTFIIINVCGADISRSTSEFLLRIVLSDIQQSVFRRKNIDQHYLWCLDEAQVLYKDKTSRENMNDLLTMSRSFGSYFMLLTQSLTSAVRDKDIINSILQNIRWAMVFRSTLRDAKIIAPAIHCTDNKIASKPFSYGKEKMLTKEQELVQELESITHFPERKGYLWLKSDMPYAVKIFTRKLATPEAMTHVDAKELRIFARENSLTNGVRKSEIEKELHNKNEQLKNVKKHTSSSFASNVKSGIQTEGQHTPHLLEQLKKAYVKKNKPETEK